MPEYLLSVHGDDTQEMPEDFDPQPMFEAVEKFNEKVREQGYWVYAHGLMPSDTATVVDGTGVEPVITDGPYLESKEHIGGFWIVDVPDLGPSDAAGQRQLTERAGDRAHCRPWSEHRRDRVRLPVRVRQGRCDPGPLLR
jgi:hypothetical protein